MRWPVHLSLLLTLWLQLAVPLQAGTLNGFELSNALIPVAQIHRGGPPRDGIPAIDQPRFVTAAQADFMRDNDRVLGISLNGQQKAYPVRILNYHEIVNDQFGDTAVVVSYCPLCGTGMAFLATQNGDTLNFGVSGLLYNSDVLLYDRQTESLWSQIRKQAVAGRLKGQRLQQISMEHTRWSDWKSRYPQSQVLSLDTGYQRDYDRSPYTGYADSERLMFSVAATDPRFHPKEYVIGVEINGIFKAYPFSVLSKYSGELIDQVGGETIRVEFDDENRTGRVYIGGEMIPSTIGFWFAWYAFHPDTLVYQPPSSPPS